MVSRQLSSKPPNQLHPAGRKGANTLRAHHQEMFILTRKVLNVGKGSSIRDHLANKHPQCTGISSTHLSSTFYAKSCLR